MNHFADIHSTTDTLEKCIAILERDYPAGVWHFGQCCPGCDNPHGKYRAELDLPGVVPPGFEVLADALAAGSAYSAQGHTPLEALQSLIGYALEGHHEGEVK